ncbi:hypothetical protein ACUXV3_17610 [Roseobacteraceae bacterium NS-SX3]
MPLKKTMQGIAALICSLLFAATASADTSYRAFGEMDTDARIQVIQDEMHMRLEQARQDNPLREACIVELFMPQGDGQLPLGYRTAINLIEFGTSPRLADINSRSVEDAVSKMIGLYCPLPE